MASDLVVMAMIAAFFAPRVAAARDLSVSTVLANDRRQYLSARQFAVLGDPGVSVLELNLALDDAAL